MNKFTQRFGNFSQKCTRRIEEFTEKHGKAVAYAAIFGTTLTLAACQITRKPDGTIEEAIAKAEKLAEAA